MKINESQLRNIIRTSISAMLKESEHDDMHWQEWFPEEDERYINDGEPDSEFDEDYDDYMDGQELDECGDLDRIINESIKDTLKKYAKKAKDFVDNDNDDISKCTGGRCKNFGDYNPKMQKIFGKDK